MIRLREPLCKYGYWFSVSLILYFLRNFSIRPAVSTSLCLPVKKGWHAEHISTRISPTVERTWNVFPQAHVTIPSLYSGWIPFFIISPLCKLNKKSLISSICLITAYFIIDTHHNWVVKFSLATFMILKGIVIWLIFFCILNFRRDLSSAFWNVFRRNPVFL